MSASRPGSTRRRGLRVAAVGVVAAVAAAVLPGLALAEDPPTCAEVIDDKLGAGYTAAFVSDWRDRIAGDDAAFDWDLYQGDPRPLYDEISAAEQHAQLDEANDRVCLIGHLAAQITSETSDPTVTPDTLQPLLYSLIFQPGFMEEAFGGDDPLEATPGPADNPALRQAVSDLRDALQLPSVDLVPRLPRLARDLLPALDVAALNLPHLRPLLRLPRPELPIRLPRLDLPLPPIDLASLRQLIQSTAGTATYLVCHNKDATESIAKDRCSLPAALGTPITTDFNNDLVPDLITTITLDLVKIANGGFGISASFRRVPGTTGKALPGRAYVVVQPPGTQTHIQIGVQNLKTIANVSTFNAQFESIQELTQGVVRGPVSISFSGAGTGSHTGVVLGSSRYEDAPTQQLDPMLLHAALSPIPSSVTADLLIDGRPAPSGHQFEGRDRTLFRLSNITSSPARTDRLDIEASLDTTKGTDLTRMIATVRDLPTTIDHVEVDSIPAVTDGQRPATLVDYEAGSTTPFVKAVVETRKATVTDTLKRATVSLTDLPASINASILGPEKGLAPDQVGTTRIDYDASSEIPEATANFVETVSGEVKTSFDAVLTGVPSDITVTNSASDDATKTDVEVDANAGLDKIVVDALLAKLTAPRQTTKVSATAHDLPKFVRVALLQPSEGNLTARYDGRTGPDAGRGSAGIGKLHARVATAPGQLPPDYLQPNAGQLEVYDKAHAFVQKTAACGLTGADGSCGATRADLRLDGLDLTDVEITDASEAEGDEVIHAHVKGPGAPVFYASADLPDLQAVSKLIPLPKDIQVDIAGSGSGSPVCPSVSPSTITPPAGTNPVAADQAGDDVTCVTYTVDGVKPTAETGIATPDIIANGTVVGVPSTASLRLNTDRETIAYSASDQVEKVTANVKTFLEDFGDDLVVDGTLTGVPKKFRLGYNAERLGFVAPADDTVGKVVAKAALEADKPALDALPLPTQNHVWAVVDDDNVTKLPGESQAGKHLLASLELTDLQAFGYSKAGGMKAAFDGAVGTALDLNVDITSKAPVAADTSRIVIDGVVQSVPAALRLTKTEDAAGDLVLDMGAGSSYPADATVLIGHPYGVEDAGGKVSQLPTVEGLTARDWKVANPADAQKPFVTTGLRIKFGAAPKSVHVETGPKIFGFGGYAPAATNVLDVDVDLRHGDPLALTGRLSGFNGTTPSGVTIGPVFKRDKDKTKSDLTKPDLSLTVGSTGVQPKADVSVKLAADPEAPPSFQLDNVLGLHLAALPKGPLTFHTTNYIQPDVPAGQKPDAALRFWTSTGTGADADISNAKITYGPTSAPEALAADVSQVPGDFFDLTIEDIIAPPSPDPCKADNRTSMPSQFPKIVYDASGSTMDATLEADFGAMSGLERSTTLRLGITNLGKDTDIEFKDAKLVMTSVPSTTKIWAEVDNITKKAIDDDDPRCVAPNEDGGSLRLEPVVDVNAGITIPRVGVTLENLQSMTMALGVVTSVRGDFGKFDLSIPVVTGFARAQVGVDVVFDFGEPFVGRVPLRVGPSINGVFVPLLHIGANAPGQGFKIIGTPIPCGLDIPPPTFGIGVQLKPGLVNGTNLTAGGFSLTDPGPDQGHAWTLTPNIPAGVVGGGGGAVPLPKLPTWAINILTFAVAPEGTSRGLGFGVLCQ